MGFLKKIFSRKKPAEKMVLNERGKKKQQEIEQRKGHEYLKSLFETSSNEIKIDSDITYKSISEIFREKLFDPNEDEPSREDIKGEGERIIIDRDNLIIDGQGYTIDTGENVGVFLINAQNIIIKNFRFYDASSKKEATIHLKSNSSCHIHNCEFKRGLNHDVFLEEESHCTFNDDDSSFRSNINDVEVKKDSTCKINNVRIGKISNHGKTELSSCSEMKIYNYGEMKLDECEFSDCKEKYHPPIENNGQMEICNSTFKNNTNQENGGIIHNRGELKISSSSFMSNGSNAGGAIASSGEILIENCIFESNRILNHGLGGALALDGKSTIKNCTFIKNTSPYNGGVIANGGDMTIINSKFIENHSSFNAGAILNFKKMNILKSEFKDNSSTDGGVIVNQGELNISESYFLKNKAVENAGVLLNNNSVIVKINDSVFEENFAKNGHVIFNKMGDVNLFDCEILNHDTPCTDYDNGNVQDSVGLNELMDTVRSMDRSYFNYDNVGLQADNLVSNALVTVNSPQEYQSISNNPDDDLKTSEVSFPESGNLIINDDIMKLTRTLIRNNHASTLILNNANAILNMFQGEIIDNHNSNTCIFNISNSFIINGTSFSNNKCDIDGLANIFNANQLTASNINLIDDGFSVLNTGAIIIKNDTNEFLKNIYNLGQIKFKKDREENIYNFSYLNELIHSNDNGLVELEHDFKLDEYELEFYEGGIELDIDNLTIDGKGKSISGNSLSRIFIITGKNITLRNIIFKEGFHHRSYEEVRTGGGSIILNSNAHAKIENCSFINNKSEIWGGAIHNQGLMEIRNDKFIKNMSNSEGAIHNKGLLKMHNCEFKENRSENYGGALGNKHEIEIYDCEFMKNSSKNYGGAIINEKDMLIKSSIFKENFQSEKHLGQSIAGGGSIINVGEDSKLKIQHCEFHNNSTHKYGGALHCKTGNIIIENSQFNDNNAKWGGALYNSSSNVKMIDSTFTGNTATEGGALFEVFAVNNNDGSLRILDDDLIEIINCKFENNTPNDRYKR